MAGAPGAARAAYRGRLSAVTLRRGANVVEVDLATGEARTLHSPVCGDPPVGIAVVGEDLALYRPASRFRHGSVPIAHQA